MPLASPSRPEFTQSVESFAAASGFTLSVFDSELRRIKGPVMGGRIASILEKHGAWEEEGKADEFERQLVARCGQTRSSVSERVGELLQLHAIPVLGDEHLFGVLVCGWTIERFSSSLECTRLARELRIPPDDLWRAVRAESPITPQRGAVLVDLLRVILRAEVSHWVAVEKTKEIDNLRQNFLARVVHDLRTPLSVIAMQIQLLKTKGIQASQQGVAFDRISRNTDFLQHLINDLVDVAKTVTGSLTISPNKIELSRTLREAADSMELQARHKGVLFHQDLAPGPIWIIGDAARLQQVFVNLISNAIKFTAPGGKVSLVATVLPEHVQVEVRDTGAGIDDETMAKIFLPFSRTRVNNEKGWGLGLAIAKQVVELHGGKLEASSAGPGTGSTFITTLPRSVEGWRGDFKFGESPS